MCKSTELAIRKLASGEGRGGRIGINIFTNANYSIMLSIKSTEIVTKIQHLLRICENWFAPGGFPPVTREGALGEAGAGAVETRRFCDGPIWRLAFPGIARRLVMSESWTRGRRDMCTAVLRRGRGATRR